MNRTSSTDANRQEIEQAIQQLEENSFPLLAQWLKSLPLGSQQKLSREILSVNWPLLKQAASPKRSGQTGEAEQTTSRAVAPEQLIRQPQDANDFSAWRKAEERGRALLAKGQVVLMVVAGGQGTRLGFAQPKGQFPIGPISQSSLFQQFCEQIRALEIETGATLPYCLMTSDATHDATISYFEAKKFFGLQREQIHFFKQGNLPALDTDTGEPLLATADSLAMSPDGHGGMLRGFRESGLLEKFLGEGRTTLYYHQVDNPAAILADPAFLGWHAQYASQVSTKVVAKKAASERMGVVVSIDGASQIIEYSDMPAELAQRVDARGQLQLWAGNTAIHLFELAFLKALGGDSALPLHVAHKPVTYFDIASGQVVTKSDPNAWKFERFIFDTLPLANSSLVVEADRSREFHPVKNRDGADSPAQVRQALLDLHRSWLLQAGMKVAPGVKVEISPLVARDVETLAKLLPVGTEFIGDLYLDPKALAAIKG
ncbi:MAG: UDP-N-acetylglucosamine pyrophosphorylase [Planctomyces sp.]|nr:UDP-N-acetylglucosamine pyrophosphorylase [Planctomyces sp.]